MTDLAQRIASLKFASSHVLARDSRRELSFADVLALVEGAPSGRIDATVAVSIQSPLTLIRVLIQLDGRVVGLLLLSPALPQTAVSEVMRVSDAKYLISDRPELDGAIPPTDISRMLDHDESSLDSPTVWFMTTSGTMGAPNVVAHTLGSLTRSVRPPRERHTPIWGLLYEPSRFAGMQVVLQSLLGGGTLLVQEGNAPLAGHVNFLLEHGCTHLSGTPTLWRKLLMLPSAEALPLQQITLGGEIADQALLGALMARYPAARLTHIYASTEAGTGFSVNDGLAGFPLSLLAEGGGPVRFKIADGMLWAKPLDILDHGVNNTARVRDEQGYIRTGDRVEVSGDRVQYLGREGSCANIGGAKIQVEAVERVINSHPDVAECLVEQKRSSIVGTLLTLRVVPKSAAGDATALRRDLKTWCVSHLPREALPATITVVDSIPASHAGKISRIS